MLVVGAGGQVGSRVVSRLLGKATVRAMSHSDASRDRLGARGVEDIIRADLTDPTSLPDAFAGIDRVFLVTGAGDASLQINAVDATAKAGVGRIVKLSSEAVYLVESQGLLGPPTSGPDPRDRVTRFHQDNETHIVATGIEHVLLRPTSFMSINETAFVAPGFREGELVWPGAATTLALIAPDDIADVAAACLLAAKPVASILHLTGPEALSLDEIAVGFSATFGRQIKHVAPSMAEYGTYLESIGIPAAVAAVIEPFVRRGARSGDRQRRTDSRSNTTHLQPIPV